MTQLDTEKLCNTLIGVFIPPLLVYLNKKCSTEFWISLILFIVIPWVGGVIFAFYAVGHPHLCQNILCIFLPPLAVFFKEGCSMDFLLTLLLTCFFWLPGVVYAYYVTW